MVEAPRAARWPVAAQRVLRWLAVALALYAALLAALWCGQEWLLFRPRALPPEHRFNVGPDVHETWIDVPGARLHALHLRLPSPDGVVYYLHGNAGHLQSWFVNVDFYRRANHDLLMLDYRGFGKSSGRIRSEAELQADVAAAWAQVAPRYAGLQRVFFGRSLGSGLAARLAAEVQPELTVLVSPYLSVAELARQHYPWAPSALLRYPLRTDHVLPRIQGRVLLLHGEQDRLIPHGHSQRLQALRPGTELLLLPGADHNDLHRRDEYLRAFAHALAQR